jgi:hypothetical protein
MLLLAMAQLNEVWGETAVGHRVAQDDDGFYAELCAAIERPAEAGSARARAADDLAATCDTCTALPATDVLKCRRS